MSPRLLRIAALAATLPLSFSAFAQMSLTAFGAPANENFDSLSSTTASAVLPTGWALLEQGTSGAVNQQYIVGTGSSNAGDSYSLGAAANTERALGSLRSGTLNSRYGAAYTNNTGGTITSLQIAYTGEQWRSGNTGAARDDRLTFEYSLDATDLNTGTWTAVTQLDFVNPIKTIAVAGALDGNLAANRTALTHTLTGLTIASGTTFRIRFIDVDATGADDVLAIDDFALTPNGSAGANPSVSVNDVTVTEGNSGTISATFTMSLSAAATTPASLSFSTADGTATVANNDYVAITNQTVNFAVGETTQQVSVTVNGDNTAEANETFAVNLSGLTNLVAGDVSGAGTITNDDFTLTSINQIQGTGLISPLNNTVVTTTGIVTAIKTNGFIIQNPDASADANPATSEAILVFTGTGLVPAAVVMGANVRVTGNVLDFIPTSDPFQPPTTELVGNATQALVVTQLSTGNLLPTATPIAAISPSGGTDQLERFEHMRVSFSGLQVVAGTDGFTSEPNATGTSNGVFFATLPGAVRPAREPGIDIRETLISAFGAITPPRFDANPETIRVDSDSQVGAPALNLTAGQSVGAITGVLDYGFRFYTFLPDVGQTIVASPASIPADVALPAAVGEVTIASYNMERFFDDINDPAISDPVLTATAYANRIAKASLQIRTNLGAPDIVGLIEIENLGVLSTLAARITADGGPTYVPHLVESNDPGGIDVAFLTKTTRVTVNSVTQVGNTATFLNPVTNAQDTLNDRAPLFLNATVNNVNGANVTFLVVVNHLRSFLGSEADTPDGNRIRIKRRAQAEFLANEIQTRQAADPTLKIVVLGDFNAFEFNDGYVDTIGAIIGNPAPATQVLLASADLVNPNLVRAVDSAANYSYVFDGFIQNIDHIFVNQALVNNTLSRTMKHVRLNADYPETFRSNYGPGDQTRLSDHDALVLRIVAGAQASSCVLSTTGAPVVGTAQTYTVTMTPTSATGTVAISNSAGQTCNAPLTAGMGSCAITHAAAGATTMTANFPASPAFQASSCTLAQTVATAASTKGLVSSLNPAQVGQAVTFTATIVGIAPTGAVNFFNGPTQIGTANLSGTGNTRTAAITLNTLPTGTLPITAVYVGDANNSPATSAVVNQVINSGNTQTTLSANPNQITFGQPVTLTATVAVLAPAVGPATGTVSFFANGTLVGTASLVNGTATLVVNNLTFGSYNFTARYDGNGTFSSSTSVAVGGLVVPTTIPSLNWVGLLLLISLMLGFGVTLRRAD